jgi:CubicO group peptidase (beta-lactamase class C family)
MSIGAMFWLNSPINGKIPWPDAPKDTYLTWGHWSQFIIIIPSENIVLVRTGTDKKTHFDINTFIKLSIEFTKGGKK